MKVYDMQKSLLKASIYIHMSIKYKLTLTYTNTYEVKFYLATHTLAKTSDLLTTK